MRSWCYRLPNEWRNGLTVRTGIYAVFSKTITLFVQLPSPVVWQGVAKLNLKPYQMLLLLSHWTCSRGVEANLATARLEGLTDSIQLSGTLQFANRDPQRRGLWIWVYWLYKHIVRAGMLTSCHLGLYSRASQILHKGCGLQNYTQA